MVGGVYWVLFNWWGVDGIYCFDFVQISVMVQGGVVMFNIQCVQLLDVDGDGDFDLFDGQNDLVYWNDSVGDWDGQVSLIVIELFLDFGINVNYCFFDFDNDKWIDFMYFNEVSIFYYCNVGGSFEFIFLSVDMFLLGVVFVNGFQLVDMNGDGFQDVVFCFEGIVQYWFNCGWGCFSDWIQMEQMFQQLFGEFWFVDLNGDSLSDLVYVFVVIV